MEEILHRIIWGNSVLEYLIAVGSVFIAWFILKIIKHRLLVLLKKLTSKTTTSFDDLLVEASERFVIPFLYLFINYNILVQLVLSQKIQRIAEVAILSVSAYFIIRLINFLIHGIAVTLMQQKSEPPERIKQVNGMLIVLKAIIWVMGIIMLADNLGYDVTTIIAGLGVGGIAIALAAQTILGDLFSYIVIFFDKPFEIGDFIIMGSNSGIVEKIGIKTSHVRSLDGQQLIMPNSEMVKSVIQNYKRLQRRRVIFNIGVVYYTPSKKLRDIPPIVQEIISKRPQLTFDRCHLKSFGDFSINYEIVYFIESADYLLYMNNHHEICLNIFESFEQQGIEFAFPTQTLFINNKTPETNTEIQNLHRDNNASITKNIHKEAL